MKTLKIQIPAGYEIDEEKSTFQEIVYKEVSKNIRDRIQTIDDVFKLNCTSEKEFNNKWKGFEDHEIGVALEKLIVNAYNEGKVGDWNDDSYKIYPYFYMDKFRLDDVNYDIRFSYSYARLCFLGDEAEENCRDAVKKFLPQYKQSRLG